MICHFETIWKYLFGSEHKKLLHYLILVSTSSLEWGKPIKRLLAHPSRQEVRDRGRPPEEHRFSQTMDLPSGADDKAIQIYQDPKMIFDFSRNTFSQINIVLILPLNVEAVRAHGYELIDDFLKAF